MTPWDGGWHMGWMGLGWLLVVAVIALAVWAAARSNGARATPLELLKRRYAKGEIDRETYQRMLKDLGGE